MLTNTATPVYQLTCDWCDKTEVMSGYGPQVPDGWKMFQSETFTGQFGYHLHWCPDCLKKVMATRTSERPLVPRPLVPPPG